MTPPTRHPSEALILDHARGVLEAGRALVLRSHLAACPECRAAVRFCEQVGGAVLEETAPAALAADALERALAALDAAPQPPPPAAAAPPPPDGWIRVPPDVVLAATRRRWAAPGVWVADVSRDGASGARSYLLGIGRGISVPQHTHKGLELICVLKGAFEDGGQVYGPGDVSESDEAVEHRPRVTDSGECVCLVAADNRLVPRSLIGWAMQPFVGI
jgi:putative transcriptional regulator